MSLNRDPKDRDGRKRKRQGCPRERWTRPVLLFRPTGGAGVGGGRGGRARAGIRTRQTPFSKSEFVVYLCVMAQVCPYPRDGTHLTAERRVEARTQRWTHGPRAR